MSRTDRLLSCAVAYAHSDCKSNVLPDSPVNIPTDEWLKKLMNVLWFEAHHSMQSTITPTDHYLCTVDLQSDQPGIVQSKDKIDIMRKEGPFPKITYALKRPLKPCEYKFDSNPSMTLEDAQSQLTKKKRKENQRLERIADQDLRKEADTLDKIEKREEGKRKRAEETTEEREARLQIAREKRAQKRQKMNKGRRIHNLIRLSKRLMHPYNSIFRMSSNKTAPIHAFTSYPNDAKPTREKPSSTQAPCHLIGISAHSKQLGPASHIEDALVKGIPNQHVSIYRGPPEPARPTPSHTS